MNSSNTQGSGSNSGSAKRVTWLDRQWERITGFDVLREYAEANDVDWPSGWYDKPAGDHWHRPGGYFRFLQGPNGKILSFGLRATWSCMSYVDVHGILSESPFYEADCTKIATLYCVHPDDEMASRLARGLRRYDDEFAQRT